MQNLLPNVTVTGSVPAMTVASISRGSYRTCKVSITGGTANVILEGRGSPADANWITLYTWTATGINAFILPPQVRMTVVSISGATVDAWLDAYEK